MIMIIRIPLSLYISMCVYIYIYIHMRGLEEEMLMRHMDDRQCAQDLKERRPDWYRCYTLYVTNSCLS